MEDLVAKGISGGGLRCLTSKGGEPITGAELRVGLNSPPQLDTGEIEVKIIPG